MIFDHGTGVQVQGLEPYYTVVLIDDGTIISRTDGNLIPPKFSDGNIEYV